MLSVVKDDRPIGVSFDFDPPAIIAFVRGAPVACASSGSVPTSSARKRGSSATSARASMTGSLPPSRRARSYMENRAPAVKRPAIVLDIDETSLSNWPAYRVNGWARITTGSISNMGLA